MGFVTCITFRAADGKLPGDVSRNWDRIEAQVPLALTRGVTFDPHDAAVYIIGLENDVDADTVDVILSGLSGLTDARDNCALLTEPSRRAMMLECFEAGRYRGDPSADARLCTA